MARDLTCPTCGETDNLRGQRGPEGLHITCEQCGTGWARDLAPACATCGGHDLVIRPRAVTQYSRGTQLSLIGWQDIALCAACDDAMLRRSTSAGGPVPADYRPAAQHPLGG